MKERFNIFAAVKVMAIVVAFLVSIAAPIVFLSGCELGTEAQRVSYNISKEADNFNSFRRVTVIDCITGDVLFVVEGWISINVDESEKQLEIISEVGKNTYKKHFIGLSDNVSYTVEDLDGNEVDRYRFTINYNPKMWVPFSLKNID